MSQEATKRCYKCSREFPRTTDFFYRNKTKWDGLATECQECNRKSVLRRARENPEKRRPADARYREKHRDQERQRIMRWAEENPDKVREKSARWAKENRDKRRANEHRRRAQKRQSQGDHTDADIKRQYKAQKGKCFWCGVKVGKTYHVDHIVPLSRGGSNSPENLVIACPACNLSKGDKLPHEWPQGGRLL